MKYKARVVSGEGRGRRIGIPTINLQVLGKFDAAHGIYAGFLWMNGKRCLAAIHFGPIPTFNDAKPTLEAHVIDEVVTEAPEELEFELIKYLRSIEHFSNVSDLVAQIKLDIETARKVLRAAQ